MDKEHLILTLERVTKQRNVTLATSAGLLVVNLMFAFSFMNLKTEVVLVPGIDREFRIHGSDVSISYLEEWSRTTLVGLLDLTAENVLHKKAMVLRHTLAGSAQDISDYFADKAKQHKEFELTTYFTETKPLEVDPANLIVKASGLLTIGYGKNNWEDREAEYLLEFKMQSGKLKLKKFKEVIKQKIDQDETNGGGEGV